MGLHSLLGLIVAGILAIVSIAIFLLTEDMSLSMDYIDTWTIADIILLGVELL
ncbi:MAG: hypothetical protein FWF66_01190 [Candidatus Bathyarchaeota archaeon]|nr:hypothetical protein [Candidatus Termiticorpusculum sp.]